MPLKTVSFVMKTILKRIIYCLVFLAAFPFKKRKQPLNPENILVIAGGYLGDTFWALQVIPVLQKKYPSAKIHVAGRSFLPVLANGLVPPERIHNAFITSDRTRESCVFPELNRTAYALRSSIHPDLVFDLMGNRYSAWVSFRMNAFTVGMDIAAEASPLYSFRAKMSLAPSPHLAYRPRSVVRQFLNEPDSDDMAFFPPSPASSKEELFRKYGLHDADKTVMLVPGAGWAEKQWQKEKFHELANYLAVHGCKVIVSGSQKEKALCEFIAADVPGSFILCDSLADTVSFLPHCFAVTGNDSGVIHVAEAYPSVKVISLYCGTNPELHCNPADRTVCLVSDCPLSPQKGMLYCRKHGGKCSRPERMNIAVQAVIEKLQLEE